VKGILKAKIYSMKKIYIVTLLSILFYTGCEKDYDEIINPSVTGYEVELISSADSLDYGLGDSIIYFQMKVIPATAVSEIVVVSSSPYAISTRLFDNGNAENGDTTAGDGIFSGRMILSNTLPSGTIELSYRISNRLAARQYIFFENGQEKFPPELSDLNIPDSVMFSETFVFSVMAVDQNGPEDIRRVYYELFRPDGSQVFNSQGISQFPMLDDGDSNGESGDAVEGDNIYSYKLAFPPNLPAFPAGTYVFHFTAEDKSRRLSNTLIHNLEVF
jgi:hypothetical protein